MKKPTAADRPQFRRDVTKMAEKLNIGVSEIEQDMVILCTRGSDFNPDHNVLWELDLNKSAVRSDVHCSTCQSEVAMSNHAYEKYKAFDKKPRICCTACVPALMAEEEAKKKQGEGG